MNLRDRLADMIRPREARALTLRSLGLAPALSSAGVSINTTSAQQVAAVSAAVDLIASQMAALPTLVYRRDRDSSVELADHPAARLLADPNGWMTGTDLREWLMRQVLLFGNGLAELVRDDAGAVVEMIPHPWPNVTALLVDGRRLVFDVIETGGNLGGSGRKRRLLPGEYLHLRDQSDDGMLGVPRISRCGQAIGVALAAQEFSASYYRNGARPSGVLSLATATGPQTLARLRENLDAVHAGPSNAAKVLILDSGAEFKPISGTPEQSELVDARRFSVEEIARVFGVPLIFLMAMSEQNYAAVARAFELLATQTLAPWCVKLEGLLTRALFSDEARASHNVVIDLSGLTRGDFEARWRAWKIARETNVLTPNEIREAEGYGPMAAPAMAESANG